ncbi:uncharacterized protein B0I36DRAFT_334751 [Microdochium trichocladiopsis]|uniref:RING-type domain-containing protein n=1 Tax=Microdochium trichocladiopsis TaxID=1682393 RepID=A0A9P9BLC5_9PEZI|nr:uncharacterized protein B0I36DRAFT_334751 [Microdochium trichocladiopsis]KAH7021567.1 hypothetical protein B0I36DRAFT_334751 [Microdochium trichocladiopsis]
MAAFRQQSSLLSSLLSWLQHRCCFFFLRLRLLDKQLQAEPFSKWRGRQQRDSAWPSLPAAVPAAESSFESQLCIICLDAIQDMTLIRALTCQHIYHKACFDK